MNEEIAGKGLQKAHRPMTGAASKNNNTLVTVSYVRGKRPALSAYGRLEKFPNEQEVARLMAPAIVL